MNDDLLYQRLERLFHEPARLAILALLIREPEGVGFTELKERLDLTFGNLDRHLKALAEAEVVEVEKRSGRGRPQTTARLSDAGRAQFVAYLDSLERLLRSASPARAPERRRGDAGDGLASPA